MIVMKFGGTSVANPVNIEKILEISAAARRERGAAAVICSAFSGVTNGLIRLTQLASVRAPELRPELEALCLRHREALTALVSESWREAASKDVEAMLADLHDVLQGIYLLREASQRSLDYVMSFGERLSCCIISYAMKRYVDSAYLDARQIIVTDKNFGLAHVDWPLTRERIRSYFQAHTALQVVTGFIGAAPDQCTTTLGRGGSDYTVSLLGAALECEEIQIWTDVSGVLTADPRKVRGAVPVPLMSYEEAMEVAHFGAKVIYPPTMAPAMAAKIPLRILNTFEPDAPGTLIAERSEARGMASAITSIESVALLQLKGAGLIGVAGFASRLFGALARAQINIILISQASSEHSICFAVKPEEAEHAQEVATREFEYEIHKGEVDHIITDNDQSIIAVVGEGMRNCPGISGRIFGSLGRAGINVDAIAQGSSELNVSLVVKREDERRALNTLHHAFFGGPEVTRLFLMGQGLIGKELIRQLIQIQAESPEMPKLLLCGLANSRIMFLDEKGIDLEQALEPIDQGRPTDLPALMAQMKLCPNAILVDCTAGSTVQAYYEEALEHGISVVTANKIANTASYARWQQLQALSQPGKASFLYETNVGAGLPVIKTLRDLLYSGDQVLRIDAVLSGTLSYLFKTFGPGDSFSDLVGQARAKGFTEPDPRDDLSGTDVARKILILARESGLNLEMADVVVENLVPEDLRHGSDVDAFLRAFAAYDDAFSERLDQARAQGKELRYVATLADGRAHVGLEAVDAQNPCFQLEAGDNIVSFTTRRYSPRPMVVKGPGAGAEVTAAQCLAEIMLLARQKR